MGTVTIDVDQTPEVLAKLAKDIRQLAQDQRYYNDESCMITCADIMDKIILELTPPEQDKIEYCPICNKPCDDGIQGCHQACIDKLVDDDEPEPVKE